MEVRAVRPEEHERLAAITVEAYLRLADPAIDDDYRAELSDVAGRATAALVLVAVDDDGGVLGGVTYVPDAASPLAEHGVEDAASIRMLAVDEPARGRGVGEALTRACIDRARAAGRREVVLHSTPWMVAAHRLYRRLGFERDESLDWSPADGVDLWGFRLAVTLR